MLTNANVFKQFATDGEFEKIVTYDNVTKMWQNSLKNYANNVAIVDDGKSYTYQELDAQISYFRGVLASKGIKAGDRVGLFLPNCALFASTFMAITTLGAVAVLLPAHLDDKTVFGCSLKFGLKALCYGAPTAERTAFTANQNKNVVMIDLMQKLDVMGVDAVSLDKTSPCAILFTGGTTGKSKGALLSNGAIMAGTRNGCYGIKNVFEQRYFLVLPLTHVFGLVRNLLTNFYTGSALFICRNNKEMFREIAMFKPTIMVLVPALAEMALTLSKQFGKNMLGEDMKTIICGAATVPPYLTKEYAKFGIHLCPGYGLTESANLVSGNPIPQEKPDSVGYFYPNQEYKVVDGELWIKGENLFDCYVGEDQENQLAFEDGWFKTGDLVKVEDDLLYIVGRKKEVIVLSSGENVSPAEIEKYFYDIDEIQDCLLYAETVNGKEILTLEVLPRTTVIKAKGIIDVDAYLRAEIEKVNAKLPSFERVNKVIIRDTDFVRSPSMKIVRNQNGNDKK